MKYGRLPRKFGNVPHLSALRRRLKLAGPTTPAPPVDYFQTLPANLGVMMNDSLGDCTCAAVYHRRQLVTALMNPPMDTQPNSIVEKLYEVFGYVPGQPSTDQGAAEQDVLTYWQTTGIPLADGSVNKLLSFVEIDPTNAIDIDWAINDCLGVYVGMNVPAYCEQALDTPGSILDVDPTGDQSIVGGHAVYAAGHLPNGNRKLDTYGYCVEMTPAFWLANVDEAYAIIDDDLAAAKTGQTILGMTIAQLQAAVTPLAQAA